MEEGIVIEGRPHLFIGIPSLDGRMSVELHRYVSALEATSITGELPFTVSVGFVTGIAPVDYARNVLAGMALNTPCVKAVMIDSDMLPEPSVTKIFYSDADIIAPRMYRFRHNGPHGVSNGPPELAACATLVEGDKRYDLVPPSGSIGIHRVDACGTGFIVIKREVLEDARMRCGENEAGVPALFRLTRNQVGRITEWEDFDFSYRASQLGYTVAVDFGARCGHRKGINLDAVAELIAIQEQTEAKEAVA